MKSNDYTFIAVNREYIKNKYFKNLAKLFYLNSKRSRLPYPSMNYFQENLTKPLDSDIGELYVLAIKENKDKVIGYGRLEYRVNKINDMTYSTMELFVEESERRKGIGTGIFKQIIAKKPEILKTIRVDIQEENYLNTLIQLKLMISPSYKVIQNVSEIKILKREVYEADLKKREQELLKDNILLFYRNNENYSDIEVEYSVLMKKTWNTPPDVEVTEIKEEDFPVERVRGMMEYIKNSGGDYHVFFAQNTLTKELVGVCHIMILEKNPKRAYQSFSGVLPSYRGRGIGYAIKLKALNYLFGTEVEFWSTENAEINNHMLKINRKLGFKEFNKINVYELQEKDWNRFYLKNKNNFVWVN